MNLEFFIADRLIRTKERKSNISAPIIKIAIAAIAIGLIMMIVSVATGVGLQNKIRQKVSAFNGHIVISNFDDNQSQVSVDPVSTNQDFYPKFNSVEGIKHIQAVASKAGIVRTEQSFEGIVFKGVGKEYDWENIKEYLVEGKLPNVKSKLNNEIIISEYLANRLLLKVGDKCNTFFMKEKEGKLPNLRAFKIVGIYNSGFQEFDAVYVLGDIRHIQRINKWKNTQVGAFEVFLNNFDQIQEKGVEVYNNTINKEDPTKALDTQTIAQKYYYIFEWLKLFDFNIVVILIIMIIVATINMIVALLVLILERTQMIGILKSVGADNWTIRKIFLYNAVHLIIQGLLWGNIIGVGLLFIQQKFGIVKLNPENYYVTTAPVDINWVDIISLNIGTILICLIVMLIPSYVVTKISPVKAIKFT
ncbi:ABC transporter permease [Flavobacterium columnare]|uniref:ABC transporter permease n=1 Tax=Flavobacterium columnare TaxID=996 RepID=UPI0007F9A7CF|nr:FtsX-like permease family protein [Flavobacterium columnare]ANO49249.1 ABC transporter permease [Flavobacterium columnare]APT22766.1 transmembrane permease [Flavobacterium columnare]MBF6653283.1 ABC transporter permease [Flavobacterium columnare]MBF6656344.1 ABC transporter permease [Flavobacterium columnare]MBF6658970.1 ABC transporter permease [Flavobacterium columnare]